MHLPIRDLPTSIHGWGPTLRRLAAVAAGVVLSLASSWPRTSLAASLPVGAAAPASSVARAGRSAPGGAAWASLSPADQRSLAPLAAQWDTMNSASRERWLRLAQRMPRMTPTQQQRVQQRMTAWSQMPSNQRGEARRNYQGAQSISPAERKARWQAYQALTPAQRQDLARKAQQDRDLAARRKGIHGRSTSTTRWSHGPDGAASRPTARAGVGTRPTSTPPSAGHPGASRPSAPPPASAPKP